MKEVRRVGNNSITTTQKAVVFIRKSDFFFSSSTQEAFAMVQVSYTNTTNLVPNFSCWEGGEGAMKGMGGRQRLLVSALPCKEYGVLTPIKKLSKPKTRGFSGTHQRTKVTVQITTQKSGEKKQFKVTAKICLPDTEGTGAITPVETLKWWFWQVAGGWVQTNRRVRNSWWPQS